MEVGAGEHPRSFLHPFSSKEQLFFGHPVLGASVAELAAPLLCCHESTSCLKTWVFKSLKQSSGGEAQAQAQGTAATADLGVIYD